MFGPSEKLARNDCALQTKSMAYLSIRTSKLLLRRKYGGRLERKWAQWSKAGTGRLGDLDIALSRNTGEVD